jgi:hypothetical protein
VTGGHGHPVRLGRAVEVAEERPAADMRAPSGRVDRHRAHRGEVDHQAVVAGGVPRHAVAAAADGDEQAVPARGLEGAGDVLGVARAHDGCRAAVGGGVPDAAGLLVLGVALGDLVAAEAVPVGALDRVGQGVGAIVASVG